MHFQRVVQLFSFVFLVFAINVCCDEAMESTTIVYSESEDIDLYKNTSTTELYLNVSEINSTDITFMLNVTENQTLESDEPLRNARQRTKDASVVIEELCGCDMTNDTCDVNCCCDKDCNADDKKVFANCLIEGVPIDDKYCYQEDIFYSNNTVFKGVRHGESNLFCIVHDNLKKKLLYKNIQSCENLSDFEQLNFKNTFSWDVQEKNVFVPNRKEMWKAGDLLFITKMEFEKPLTSWTLPSQCFSSMCDCEKVVLFIEDISSSCMHTVLDLSVSCETNPAFNVESYTNFCFPDLLEPSVETTTESADLSGSKSENNTYKGSDKQCIYEENALKPTYNASLKECQNVMSGVHYNIWHNGIYGIVQVQAHFIYTTIKFHDHSFMQQFSINFKWLKNITTSTVKRSGNPGYRLGYPLITGYKISNGTNVNEELFTLLDSGLAIMKSSDGKCNGERKTIGFRQNLWSGCLIRKSDDCADLQKSIFSNLTGDDGIVYISAFGNANINDITNWVKVLHDYMSNSAYEDKNTGICNLVLSVHIQIAYAAVGSFVNPQYKIVGVLYKYGSPQPVDLLDYAEMWKEEFVSIACSVNFIDVSEPASNVFRKLPVLNARLPSDFFYPFLLNHANMFQSCFVVIISLVLICLISDR